MDSNSSYLELSESLLTPPRSRPRFSRSPHTRTVLWVGNSFFLLLGLVCTALSAYIFHTATVWLDRSHRPDWVDGLGVDLRTTGADLQVGPVFLALLVTLAAETTGLAHTASLRWALARQGKLEWCTNMRLFASAGGPFTVNGRFTNGVFALALVLAYSSSALTLVPDGEGRLAAGPLPFLVLGICLAILAGVGHWSLATTTKGRVPTWSAHPLDIAAAIEAWRLRSHHRGRCMRGATMRDSKSTEPVRPSSRQASPWTAHPHVRTVVFAAWAVVLGVAVWTAVAWSLTARHYHGSFPSNATAAQWSPFASASVRLPIATILKGSPGLSGIVQATALVVEASMQLLVTVGLHACDLLAGLSRDEDLWRECASGKGGRTDRSALVLYVTSWETMSMFALRTGVHYLFGRSVQTDNQQYVYMQPIMILYLTLLLAAAAGFMTYLGLRARRGPQPAAYGHVQTLIDLIDDWATPHVFWGHKSLGEDKEVAHAGTSDIPLGPIAMDMVYAGGPRWKDVAGTRREGAL